MYTVYIYTSHHWNLLLRKASVSLNWSPSRKKFRNSPEIERTTLGPISDSTLTYRRWSRRSTRSCGGKQLWSTWQTSQQPALAPRRRRTWRPHWSWRESCLRERGQYCTTVHVIPSHRLCQSWRGVLPPGRPRSCTGGRTAQPGYRTWRSPTGSRRCRGPRHCSPLPDNVTLITITIIIINIIIIITSCSTMHLRWGWYSAGM